MKPGDQDAMNAKFPITVIATCLREAGASLRRRQGEREAIQNPATFRIAASLSFLAITEKNLAFWRLGVLARTKSLIQ